VKLLANQPYYHLKMREKERQYASRWSMLLTAVLCIPYMLTLMESIAHSLFRNRKGPSFTDIIVVNKYNFTLLESLKFLTGFYRSSFSFFNVRLNIAQRYLAVNLKSNFLLFKTSISFFPEKVIK
jgi:hypothetical protein